MKKSEYSEYPALVRIWESGFGVMTRNRRFVVGVPAVTNDGHDYAEVLATPFCDSLRTLNNYVEVNFAEVLKKCESIFPDTY
jgi:hypothetical protein